MNKDKYNVVEEDEKSDYEITARYTNLRDQMIREDKIPKHVDTNICSEYNVITKLIAVRTGGKCYGW